MGNITVFLGLFSPCLMISITIFSPIWHSSWRRTSDKLPVMAQVSPIAGCFYVVCFKLVLLFLLSLEFWLPPYLFCLHSSRQHTCVFKVYYCLLSSDLAERMLQALNNLLCLYIFSFFLVAQILEEEMLDIQGTVLLWVSQ